MGLREVATATIFYLPFLLTILFGILTLLLGLATLLSGTLLFLFFAAYGIYSVARDTGFLEKSIRFVKTNWTFVSQTVVDNLERTFLLRNPELLPSEPALFICHPHGLFGHSWILHFCYGISPWPQDKPRPVLAIHSILFRLPFLRDVLEQCRCIEASEETITKWLHKGHSVAILTGGIEEMKTNGSKQVNIVLEKRKGYARIAKNCNVPIVPMFAVGEHQLFPNETFWLWTSLNRLIYRWTGISIPLPSWKSMVRWSKIVEGPLSPPRETFVLPPVTTQGKEETAIRKECIQTMKTFLRVKQLNAKIIA